MQAGPCVGEDLHVSWGHAREKAFIGPRVDLGWLLLCSTVGPAGGLILGYCCWAIGFGSHSWPIIGPCK